MPHTEFHLLLPLQFGNILFTYISRNEESINVIILSVWRNWEFLFREYMQYVLT